MELVQIRKKLAGPWRAVWNTLPTDVQTFLNPYYRKYVINNRLFLVFWPTFRCNYSCSYCPVHTKFDFATVFPKSSEKSWEQWVEALEKLPPAMIYVAGGEPFLYAGLPDLLNNLPAKHELLGIVSNLSMPARVIKKIKKPTRLNASLHRECVSTEAFIEKVKELQESFHIVVNIVATPENLPAIEAVDALLKSHNISLHVDPYIDTGFEYSKEQLALLKKHAKIDRASMPEFNDFSLKSCSAGRNYINLMPNGDAFACASGFEYVYSPLFSHVVGEQKTDHYRMKNLFDPAFSLNTSNISCTLPCQAYCDRDMAVIKVVGPSPSPEIATK
jgi:MoaA/NifB/PqqE/SkfB family radical SAM enzyme